MFSAGTILVRVSVRSTEAWFWICAPPNTSIGEIDSVGDRPAWCVPVTTTWPSSVTPFFPWSFFSADPWSCAWADNAIDNASARMVRLIRTGAVTRRDFAYMDLPSPRNAGRTGERRRAGKPPIDAPGGGIRR